MIGQRNAVVLTDDDLDFTQWCEANKNWLTKESRIFRCAPEGGGPLLNASGAAIADDDVAAMSSGFLLTRPDWRVDNAFGETAAAGGFALATGRLMSQKTAPNDAMVFEDVAPYLVAQHIEQFAISAAHDGFLCRKLPLECLWVGSSCADEILTLLADGEPAADVVDAIVVGKRLTGGVRQAYLSDMKALWRRASDIKTCVSFLVKA